MNFIASLISSPFYILHSLIQR